MKVCIAEKPSVAREIAEVLGATQRMNGYIEGNGYQVTWTFGHLCTLKEPHEYAENWKRWSLGSLPMIPPRFGIKLIENPTYEQQFKVIESLMQNAEMVINCGDAGQEGELIQRWVMQKAGCKCPVYRLWIKKIQQDSAIYYIKRNMEIASFMKDTARIYTSRLRLATLYAFSGMYRESESLLRSIDRELLSKEQKQDFYEAYYSFFSYYSTNLDSFEYRKQLDLYKDSLLSVLDTVSYRYKINLAQKYLAHGQARSAEKVLIPLLEKEERYNPNFAMITYLLGDVYDMDGRIDLARDYYTLSVIADIKRAFLDSGSIQKLALNYYESGDLSNALKYAQLAIEGAVTCNIQFRMNEISKFYPIINASYQTQEAQGKRQLMTYFLLISLLTLFLILSLAYVYRQMRKISAIREELVNTNACLVKLNGEISETNNLLQERNIQLSESNHIKEEYIAHFLDLCSTYINKLEDYQKSLQKKAMNKQLDELFKMLRSTRMVENEVEALYVNFDRIFLGLYPTFVRDFNALLQPEERIVLKSEDLLNKELRIFALMRLGVTDSVRIAAFLRCSLSTIYNYRTKVRNKALVPRDEFEGWVMRIGINRNPL